MGETFKPVFCHGDKGLGGSRGVEEGVQKVFAGERSRLARSASGRMGCVAFRVWCARQKGVRKSMLACYFFSLILFTAILYQTYNVQSVLIELYIISE